jgi:hypothetical protein
VSELIDEYDIRPEEVLDIRVGIAEHSLLHGGAIDQPTDVTSAQFSLGFSIALRIAKRANDLTFIWTPRFGMTKKSWAVAKGKGVCSSRCAWG